MPDGVDGLVVTGGGTTLVATDAMLTYLERLRLLIEDLDAVGRRLQEADHQGDWRTLGGGSMGGLPPSAVFSEAMIDEARVAVRTAHDRAELLATSVRTAVTAYSETERMATAAQDLGTGLAVGILGPVARGLGMLMLPGLAGAAAVVAGAWTLAPGTQEEKTARLQDWLLQHPELVTSPLFADAVRGVTEHLDDLAWSGIVPGAPAALLGSDQLGITGVETSAVGILAAGGALGLFRESAVSVTRVSEETGTRGARGSAERLDRVPEVDQVRIEKYDAPGSPPRYVVYVGPTETFSPAPSGEPWDLTSNVGGVAGLPVASLRATELAMADAGIEPGSEVQLVGFSQGALVATMVAADGRWNAQGLETYAAPAGNIPLDPSLPGMAVRHTDDFIPALAGEQRDERRLQIERQAYPDGAPTGVAAPAHQKASYEETARLIDDAGSPQVRSQIAAMDAFTSDYTSQPGSTVEVFRYHADRVGPTRPLVG